MPDIQDIDLVIVGSGPAGYAASIYASRYKVSNVVVGRIVGGTMSEAHKICNYPGFEEISGLDLGFKFEEQAKKEGAVCIYDSVVDIKKEDGIFLVYLSSEKIYRAKAILLANGTVRTKIGLPNEDSFVGKGLSYCATCDAMLYRNKKVAVVGGSNAATMAASMLSDIASEVYLIYRGTELRGEPAWIDQVSKRDNVHILYTTLVVGLEGKDRLERLKLSKEYKGSEYLDIDGLFVEIGSEPNKDLPIKIGIDMDSDGYIKVGKDQSTNIDGIWAAGDCTDSSNKFRQVVTAVSEGSIAANAIYKYLKS